MKNIKQERQGRVFGRGCVFTQGSQRGRHDEKMIFSKELKEMREEGMWLSEERVTQVEGTASERTWADTCWVCLKDSKEASVAGGGWVRGRVVGAKVREQSRGTDPASHNDDFVFTSSKMVGKSWEGSEQRKNMLCLISYQNHDGCCVENRLKWGKAKLETEGLITRLLQ